VRLVENSAGESMAETIVKSFYLRTGKRWLDAVAALAGLIILSPLLLIAGLVVRATSRGSIFFRQERVGQHGRIFRIFKFRSMNESPSQVGALLTAAGDSRITPVGRMLRKTKIDELPQLINVLVGEMSLVGPRPEVPKYVSSYTQRQKSVLLAKPGVTGPTANRYIREEDLLAQQLDREAFYVNVLLPDKLEMDLQYCKRITFSHDLKLMFTTFANIFVTIAQLDKPLPGTAPKQT